VNAPLRQPARQHAGGHRRNALWVAAMVHRISGLALACFLPLHFLTLGLAIDGEARLDGTLKWMDAPLFKIGETVLVFLLVVHMLGGIRVLLVENMAWHEGQKNLAFGALALAGLAALAFLVRAI
jgi:fumarate reductase subunit D